MSGGGTSGTGRSRAAVAGDGAAHRETWMNIPWLVNGTLAPSEAARAQAHLDLCPSCRAEYAAQSLLARAVAAAGPSAAAPRAAPVAPPSARSVAPSDARAASRPASRPGVRRSGGPGFGGGARRAVIGLAAACAALVVVGVLGLGAPEAPPPEGYRTLTDPAPAAAPTVLKLRARPDADPAALRARFVALGLAEVAPPTPELVWTLRAADPAAAAAAAAALAGDPGVAFVAPPAS